ncbi:MAG: hypothetical protein AB7S81_03440 [Bdellovibrionales bacterium]
MAKDKEGKKKENSATQKKGGGGKIIFFMILIGCLIPFSIPTLIVCAGFLPTFVVLLTETDPRHPGLTTIGYMNLAGVLPFIIDLWQQDQTMGAAMSIIKDPSSWVVMLGAAGVGQLILYVVPHFVATMVVARQESRRRVLRDGLAELEKIWGKDVSNTLPIELVRQHQDSKGQ